MHLVEVIFAVLAEGEKVKFMKEISIIRLYHHRNLIGSRDAYIKDNLK